MGFKFNPFSGNFDQTGAGGGGSAFFAGEVATYADLPLDGTAALNSRWLVRSNSGTWPFSSYKQAGIYIRTATGGTDRGADYTLTDTSFHDVMSDDAFLIFDNTDPTKAAKFDASAIATGTTRTITVPNKNLTLDDAGDSRTPSAHAASHAAAGSDPLFDQDLNTDSLVTFDAVTVNDNLTFNGEVGLFFGSQDGAINTRTNLGLGTAATADIGTGEGDVAAGDHNHAASAITSGTLAHERGGLEADVSAYNGLVKISGGSTSAVTVTTAGEALLDDVDAAAQRTTLGLGGAATLSVGTTTGTVAAGDDSRFHTRSHAMTGTSDHTAGNWSVFYSNGSGQVTELALGAANTVLTSNGASSAPSFAAASGGSGATNLFIPASAFIPRTTTGAGVDSREIGSTNRTNWDELLFDTGTQEFAQATVVMPSNYNNGTISARFYWTCSTAPSPSNNNGIVMGIRGRAFGDNVTLDAAMGAGQQVADTVQTINFMHVTSATPAVTIDGTPAANKAVQFEIYRVPADSSDNYGFDLRLLGVEIIFN